MTYLAFIAKNARLILFGFALAFASSFGQTFFIALFGADLRAEFDLGHAGFGGLYSAATFASGLTLIWAGGLVDRYDLRAITVATAAGLVGGCLALAVAPSAALLVVAIFLLRFCGQGMLSHIAMTSMARYFDGGPGGTRGKAISLAALGHPAGEALLPMIAVATAAALGWRATWLAAAGLVVVLLAPAIVVALRHHTARHAEHLARAAALPTSAARDWTRAEVLRDPRFYLKLPAVLAPAFIVTGVFFHQTHLAEARAWELATFAQGFAVFAVATVASAVLAGPLVDRFGAVRLLPFFLLPLAAGLVAFGASDDPAVAFVFMALGGMTQGLGGTTVQSMWAERYGVRHLGAIRALAQALAVLSTSGSPVLLGALIDAGASVPSLAFGLAAYTGVAIALVIPATLMRPRRA